jgi:nitroimidazol reductase NimA-like FMN-containing flavoprotein (pyridoxamine 5'-phosphate oxidase superfamily)
MPDTIGLPSFTPTNRTRVRRVHERGRYDRDTVFAILDAAMMCHIGYVIDGQPYVTPTLFWREGEKLYWHGSSASRMLRSQTEGIPVCLTVTHVDGLVVARSGFHHSLNYRAVMAFGTAAKVEDPAEKEAGLNAFVDRVYPGRTDLIRGINGQELKATTLLGMTIEEASAKIRVGGPVDDEEDYAADCWAGVIPVTPLIGAAIPDPRLKPGIPAEPETGHFPEGAAFDQVLLALARRGGSHG